MNKWRGVQVEVQGVTRVRTSVSVEFGCVGEVFTNLGAL